MFLTGMNSEENNTNTGRDEKQKYHQGLENMSGGSRFPQGEDGKGGICLHILLISTNLPKHPKTLLDYLKNVFLVIRKISIRNYRIPKLEKWLAFMKYLPCVRHCALPINLPTNPVITLRTLQMGPREGHRDPGSQSQHTAHWLPSLPSPTGRALAHSQFTDFLWSHLIHPSLPCGVAWAASPLSGFPVSIWIHATKGISLVLFLFWQNTHNMKYTVLTIFKCSISCIYIITI